MSGPVVLLFVFAIAGLLTVAFLLLDESVDRWLWRRSVKRDDARAQAEWEAMQRELAPKYLRSGWLYDLAEGKGDGSRPDTPGSS